MALDYTKLFGDVGKVIKHINLLEAISDSTLPTAAAQIAAQFDSVNGPIDGLPSTFDTMKSTVDGWREQLAAFIDSRLLDRDTVLAELNLSTSSVSDVLSALLFQMADDGETVLECAASAGSPAYGSGNTGTMKLLTTLILDGLTSPGGRAPAHLLNNDRATELTVNETMLLVCAQDSYADGLTAGQEVFSLSGGIAAATPLDYHAEGSGVGPDVQLLNAQTLISNRDFENFATTDVPDNWTIDAGVASTNVFQDTGTFFRGASALKFVATGIAEIAISQEPSAIQPRTGYFVAVALKADSSIADGTLVIQFEGTDYTPGGTEKIEISSSSLPTSWTTYSFYLNTPAALPADFKLVIKWTDTPTNAKSLWLDSLACGLPVRHGGVGLALVAGDVDPVQGDRVTVEIENDGASAFQQFFRRYYAVQLPSDASPTIANSLAT